MAKIEVKTPIVELDGTPFAETLERVCVAAVEGGFMTKDLASLIGKDQK